MAINNYIIFFLVALFFSLVSCTQNDIEYIELRLPHKSENLATNESHYPDAPVSPRMVSSLARSASLSIIRKFLRLSAIFFCVPSLCALRRGFYQSNRGKEYVGIFVSNFQKTFGGCGNTSAPLFPVAQSSDFHP